MSIRSNFVFVVFNDPDVVGVIDFLCCVLNEKRSHASPHLTIQGPFNEKVSIDSISAIKRRLKSDVFFIGNPGVFETEQGIVLFLRVNSDNLIKVWDKPDFPLSTYGFNPHITLYEGSDKARAKRALDCLKKNRVELLCREFDVVQYVPKQYDMFPITSIKGNEGAISTLIGSGKIGSSFRSSFMAAVNRIE
ncbi:hypothetical protein [Lysobacter capsici]|uniref:hypothetical protein n=1 Tax=Lysobacter capsici TaxID=435897 RepID=UPI00128D16EA|nr:hypothetical protein [Lysobacter capsici]